ncbi:hypothetical protein ACFOEE_14240 [Pseudoalteromonas fenneropenaei]|uniref:Solute-binding protein family 3/N-terminal domain-containing protein n=1 Tax=Pseudoalteromonas fenneropenaei TaxID=1737459 RepID=A0ABV7CM81_9GAMM
MRLLLKWLLFAGMSLAVAQVFALSSANLQQSNTPLSVALLNSPYPPYVLSPEQGSGIVLDILRAYSEATGQPLKIQYAPEVRTLKLIQTQQVDARIESETWFLGTSQHCWSLPLLPVEDVVVTSSDTSFQHIEQLRGAIFLAVLVTLIRHLKTQWRQARLNGVIIILNLSC